jgi:hypothetical protein
MAPPRPNAAGALFPSPLAWGVPRRLAVAAACSAGLWLTVGWALAWWG